MLTHGNYHINSNCRDPFLDVGFSQRFLPEGRNFHGPLQGSDQPRWSRAWLFMTIRMIRGNVTNSVTTNVTNIPI